MGTFKKGQIVVIDFPFSNLEESKTRPAYIASADYEDLILCQITSTTKYNSIKINEKDFEKGKLNKLSYIRPNKIFTLEKKKINYTVGKLNSEKIKEIQLAISKIFN